MTPQIPSDVLFDIWLCGEEGHIDPIDCEIRREYNPDINSTKESYEAE